MRSPGGRSRSPRRPSGPSGVAEVVDLDRQTRIMEAAKGSGMRLAARIGMAGGGTRRRWGVRHVDLADPVVVEETGFDLAAMVAEQRPGLVLVATEAGQGRRVSPVLVATELGRARRGERRLP